MRKVRQFLMREVHQSYCVVGMAVGIVSGAIVAVGLRVNYFGSPVWLILVGLLLGLAFVKPKITFLVLAVVAGMIMMFFRVTAELAGEDYIRHFWGETVLVKGKVEGDPNSDEKGTKIKLTNLAFGEEGIKTTGSIYVTLKANDEIRRADEVTLNGKMVEGFGTYAGYMYRPRVEAVRRAEPGDLVLGVRNWFAGRVQQQVAEPEVALGLSYLLGMKAGLDEDLNENLRMVGLVHIVVASGAHLSILVEIARRIFGKITRMAGLVLSIMFVIFFMAMVGWTPSIMRAGVMAIMTIMAWYVGRKIAAWRLILLVAALTLIINPMNLINLGWLLSFASYAGIMILGPRLAKFFYGEKKPGFVASMILTTISATLMTLPITLYYFGTVSLISVVANLLILPTLPVAMGLTFLAGVVSGVPLVETGVAFVATKLLDFHIAVVEWFGGMRQFMIEMEPYQGWVFGLYGMVLLIGLLGWKMVKLGEE